MKNIIIWKRVQHLIMVMLSVVSMGIAWASGVPVGTDYSQLNKGDMEKSYRTRIFRAYLPIAEQSRRLKIGELDRFENATGIYFEPGEKAIITVTGGGDQHIKLIIYNSFRKQWYDLKEGRNVIEVKNPGLAYIDYRSMTPQEEDPIKVQIEGGKINGVMTMHDHNDTWKKLLANAKCEVIDLIGERAHMLYWVPGLRKGCPDDGAGLIKLYDEIVAIIEDDLLGFDLYKIHTGGHVLLHATEKGFMSAGGDGVNFGLGVIPNVSNVEGVRKGGWGVAHELGHIFQTRPGMKWAGMTETTNNICSMYVNYKLGSRSMRLEYAAWPNSRGEKMHASLLDCFVNNAITQRQIWQFYSGTLPKGLPEPWAHTTRNVNVNLAPLWQMLLYNMEVRGQKDFYPQIYQNVRNTDESKMTQGELRVLFFKRVCDAAKLNFSEYFVKTGMLVPMDREARDYSAQQMTITRKMCEDAIQYASQYPAPDSHVIYYITAFSMPIYRDKLNVVKPPKGAAAPTIVKEHMEIPASMWKNAVAFEAYKDNDLLHISLFSLNHPQQDGTTVICPEGTNKVLAVQWDGKRYTVLNTQKTQNKPKKETLQQWFAPRGLGINSLHEAAIHDSVEGMKALMTNPIPQYDPYGDIMKMQPVSPENRPDINKKNEQGDTPLHLAALYNHPKMVQALLEAGANCTIRNAEGKTALELAQGKKTRKLLEAAEARRKQEIKLFDAIKAGDEQAIRKGLQENLSPDAVSADGSRTLLTEAVSQGKADIVHLLVEAGAEVNRMPSDGQTALHIAASLGNVEIIDFLLKHGADHMLRAKNGATPLLNAVWGNHLPALKRLLPCYKSINFSPERQGGYPIYFVIQRNNVPLVKAFIEAGLDVNDKIFANDPLLVLAARLNRQEIGQLLLQAGAKKDAQDNAGKRAADYAQGNLAELLK